MSRSKNNIFHYIQFHKERVSDGDTFRCRKCRTYLFSSQNLTSFHKKIEPVDQCSCWYLSCDGGDDGRDLSWIRQAVDESEWTEGKIYCPKCSSRIGAFNITQGVRCSCFAYVIPAVWIQKGKVDQVTIADSKPNIRLPRQPGDPGSHHGNSDMQNSQSGQTGSQTGQAGYSSSGSPSSQGCNDGKQTSQSRQTGYSCCDTKTSQTGHSGLSTVTPEKESESIDSEAGPSGLCICSGQNGSKQVFSQNLCQTSSFHHGATISNDVLSTFPTVLKNEPEQGLQLEDRQHSQFWPSIECQHHKTFTNGCQCKHGPECHGFMERGASNCNCFSCNDSGSIVYRRNKSTQHDRDDDDGNSCTHDCPKIHERSTEDKRQYKEETVHEESEIPEHLICPICLDLLYEPLTSPCDHVFCDSCLRLLNSKSRKSVPRCPLCRKLLNYVYPAVDLREEIRQTHPQQYRKRHKAERRAPHRRLPLPSGRLKNRKKNPHHLQDVPMPYSVLVFLVCVLAVCVLCLVILFVFCPPTSNRCVTIIGYE